MCYTCAGGQQDPRIQGRDDLAASRPAASAGRLCCPHLQLRQYKPHGAGCPGGAAAATPGSTSLASALSRRSCFCRVRTAAASLLPCPPPAAAAEKFWEMQASLCTRSYTASISAASTVEYARMRCPSRTPSAARCGRTGVGEGRRQQ